MRKRFLATALGAILSGAVLADDPVVMPTVKLSAPVPTGTPLAPLPAPLPGEFAPAPPTGFNVGSPVGIPGGSTPSVFPARIAEPPATVTGPRIWGGFEYLLWFAKGSDVPPLVSVVNGPAALARPIDPRAASVLNDATMNDGAHSGFRATLGLWFDPVRSFGVEANYLWFVRDKNENVFTDGPGTVLARPFTNANTGNPGLLALSTPTGSTRAAVQVRTSFEADGAEVNALFRGPALLGEDVHWLAGFRYWGLDEHLRVESISATATPKLVAGSFDEFATRNRFYGGQVGARWNFMGERWTADATGKIALGGMGQDTTVSGGTGLVVAGNDSAAAQGGLLALGTNIGRHDRTKIVFIPEVSLNLGYRVTPHITMFVGYDFLYVSDVLRPGPQIDTSVNPSRLPFSSSAPTGPIRPAAKFDGESFWMQGINFGVALRF